MKSPRKKKKKTAVRKVARPASRARKKLAPAPAPAPAVAAATTIDTAAPEAETGSVQAVQVAQPAPQSGATASLAPQRAGLKLESSFTLRDATDMLFQLLAVDFGDSDVHVDGGGVERIDTAGLQMLIAFARYHVARGKAVHWTAVSPELLRSSQLLGITEPLHLTAHLNEGASGGH